jgi:hypothetical protein
MSSIGGLGRFFLNSLMHCLAERPPKNKNIYFWTTIDLIVISQNANAAICSCRFFFRLLPSAKNCGGRGGGLGPLVWEEIETLPTLIIYFFGQ